MSRNYAINSNKPAFAVEDDMASTFLKSSGGPYLASSRMAPPPYNAAPPQPKPWQRQEDNNPFNEQQSVMQQIRDVETRTMDSTKRSLQALADSEEAGVETAKSLAGQREQLQNTSKMLDNMNQDLKESEKNISAIQSVFSSFRQWMSAPKKSSSKNNDDKDTNSNTSETPEVVGYTEPSLSHNPRLEKAVNSAPEREHTSYRLRGIDYDEEPPRPVAEMNKEEQWMQDRYGVASDNWQENSRRVDKQLDKDLDNMSSGLSRLHYLALGLGDEIRDQNQMVDDIAIKADNTHIRINNANMSVTKLLKK